jgi:formylglycine-generating enzyme required for sulfatase activity
MPRVSAVAAAIVAIACACNAIDGASKLAICSGDECVTPAETGDGGPPGPPPPPSNVVDAGPDGTLPADCTTGQVACAGRVAAACISGKWKTEDCPETCDQGVCAHWPSCRHAGGDGCGTGTSCCIVDPVTAGAVDRRNDTNQPATVSAFALDRYEVTVGRFRAFVDAGGATQAVPPAFGVGAHPKIPGSGWSVTWNVRLPATVADLKSSLANGTWTDAPAGNEHQPIDQVSWFEAFAFCAWDGGRLPTLAEWYRAANGGDDRMYPWSSPPTDQTIDSTFASYNCAFSPPARSCDINGVCSGCAFADIAPVGSYPTHAAKFGHLDLAGNLGELVLDSNQPFQKPCIDCAALVDSTKPDNNVYVLGGGWRDNEGNLRNNSAGNQKTSDAKDDVGFRCARDL